MPPYYIEVSDNSLQNAGITEGDVLRLCRASFFASGDLAVVETPDGLFVRYAWHERGGRVRLIGAHPRCRPRTYPRRTVTVLAVWRAGIRCDDEWEEYIPG